MSRDHEIIQHIDNAVGKKIYAVRVARGLTRNQLGKQIGVTGTQLEKYEKGINRMALGRLVLIARALKKNVEYFYTDDLTKIEAVPTDHEKALMELSSDFSKIEHEEDQETVRKLVKRLAAY